jgi:sialate O-acetylesterase
MILLMGLLAEDMSASDLSVAGLFTDHAVLQRDQPIPIWGTAVAGVPVTVEFASQTKTAATTADGTWSVRLDPITASGEGRTLVVRSAGTTVMRTDVVVGDVWLCSGQSNMGMAVGDCADAEREIAAADHPQLRLFSVPQRCELTPQTTIVGNWTACSPRSIRSFSGTAYYFGRAVQQALDVPIGLLHSSYGGTAAESWTSLAALNTIRVVGERSQAQIIQYQAQPEALRRFPAERQAWEEAHHVRPPPIAALAEGWQDPTHDASSWKEVTLPATWEQLGFSSGGVFWLRKEITVPERAAGKAFMLKLLYMTEQYDTAFWNGTEIGHGGDQSPDFYFGQHPYLVPAAQVHAGRNVLTLRIASATEKVGVWTWGSMLEVPVQDPGSIDDRWLLRQESAFAHLDADALAARPKLSVIPARDVPASLFNGMIAPLIPFAIRGAVWYQGESNGSRPNEYRQLLTAMITDWRNRWGQGDFPFLIQQLVNNGAPPTDANQPANWAFLREAQLQVADGMPNIGISAGPDLGDRYTIHPTNKQEVGRRLALVALEKCYGRAMESSGPRYAGMAIVGNAIRVRFAHAAGLASKDGPLLRFSIAGSDRMFAWAEAHIDGDAVVVSAPHILQPVAVRYAWAENPAGCNLINGAGLPASPFRTDSW